MKNENYTFRDLTLTFRKRRKLEKELHWYLQAIEALAVLLPIQFSTTPLQFRQKGEELKIYQ